jgi:CheY-like chemotaxis protein
MMPGMDGFQAVQSIKNNPRTATIPILMYTSQEGDLYLGQARALGAEGVLPKQIKQADVTKMLYQLRLVSDRRGGEQTTFARMAAAAELLPANESAIVATAPSEASNESPAPESQAQFSALLPRMTLEIRAALDTTLQKALNNEMAALRNFIGTTLDSHSERLQGDLSALLPATRTPELDLPTLIPERRPWAAITGWSLAILAAGGAAFLYWLWWNQGGEIAALHTDLDAAYAEVEALRARPEVVSQASLVIEPGVIEPGAIEAGAIEAGAADPADVAPAADAALVPPAAAATKVPVAADSATPAPLPASALPVDTAPPAAAASAATRAQ